MNALQARIAGPAPRDAVPPGNHWLLDAYRRHATEVYRYLSRLTGGDRSRTEDLTQEVFLKAARTASRPDDAGIAWLIAVARTTFLQQVRSTDREERRIQSVPSPSSDGLAVFDSLPDVLVTREAVRHLSDAQRAVLVLRYVDDLPVAQVAHLLGRSVDATESLIARALRSLRTSLGAAGYER